MAIVLSVEGSDQTLSENDSGNRSNYQEAQKPNYHEGSFTIDDSDEHYFEVDARGKGRLGMTVDISTSDQNVVCSLFGAHASGITNITGDGIIQIGADFTVTPSEDIEYHTCADPFPFYLLRCTPAASATGTPICKVYIDFVAY